MSAASEITITHIPNLPCRRGKVRDVYDLGDEILLVATDRISAYDVVMPTPIPGKGAMLTAISKFWFAFFDSVVPHHLIEVIGVRPEGLVGSVGPASGPVSGGPVSRPVNGGPASRPVGEDPTSRPVSPRPAGLDPYMDQLRGRTMRCRKTAVVPIEFVVRGYLAGSGWKEYREGGAVCGVKLPPGLTQCDKLPEPIFTPATKEETGHDENISFERACEIVGRECMTLLRDRSLDLYRRASDHARTRGIIIADTKFEWGRGGDEYLLIDEVLTPDSSRFWPADKYAPGRDQESFDKQYVRNYLTTLVEAGKWDKTPPGPELPEEIVRNTAEKYQEAVRKLTA